MLMGCPGRDEKPPFRPRCFARGRTRTSTIRRAEVEFRQEIDGVDDFHWRTAAKESRSDLQKAPRVGGHHGARSSRQDVRDLPLQEPPRRFGLCEIVGACAPAAVIRLMSSTSSTPGRLLSSVPRRAAYSLAMGQVAGVVVGDTPGGRRVGVGRATRPGQS